MAVDGAFEVDNLVSANDMKVDVNLAPAEANDITFGDQTLFVGDSVFTGYNQIMSSSDEPITVYLDETFTEMPANAVVHDVSRVVLAFIDHVRFPSKIEDSTAHALNPHYQGITGRMIAVMTLKHRLRPTLLDLATGCCLCSYQLETSDQRACPLTDSGASEIYFTGTSRYENHEILISKAIQHTKQAN